MTWIEEKSKQLRGMFKSETIPPFDDDLETPEQYKERWRSIYIVYFTMFLISLGFSIIVTGVWPYLDKIDPTASKEFMGFIIAANPFAQMIFSPLVGWWTNRLGSIRLPLISSLTVFMISSAIYSCLEIFPSHRKHWMLWSRFLVGVSSASVTACRSYLSAATRYSERTKAVSMISLAQIIGFIVGPAVQAALVPLGGEGVWLIQDRLKLNMYTASGWFNVFLTLINMYCFFPSMFKEHKIAVKEALVQTGKDNAKEMWKEENISYVSAWSAIIAFFVLVFNFMLLETLGTPLTMDQFAWSKSESLWYMGILMSVGAVVAIMTFASIAPLSRRFSEIKIMIWFGFFLMVLGRFSMIPFSGDTPKIYDSNFKLELSSYCDTIFKNKSSELNVTRIQETLSSFGVYLEYNARNESAVRNMTLNCGEDVVGCPSNQKWCSYTPAMGLAQFILGYMFTSFGYPIAVTLLQTIFSKLLGSKPQGVWMGFMVGAGCLSRVMGPIFVTYIYEEYGTVWTFGFTTVMMIVCQIWLLWIQKSLNPDLKKDEATTDQELQETSKFASVDLEVENGIQRNCDNVQ
ncbi:major facilitator superfamily domain-containing protein 8 [Diabrotica virgifera virgifera]|uniref:Major facilitator superfamily (MFS) profile domain-containing protein n=1 Tax=Diabrotica virgifera virgifera TaxID=50390 RepID=A0ABM5KQY1_DIAVI|nr:major facilitator superfamily domain-containing protein 8 [Diabrotica virgifera virgifera]